MNSLNSIVGFLIYYYRNQKKQLNSNFTQKNFISYIDEQNQKKYICSNHTLVKIEHGEISNNEEHYLQLVEKLNLIYSPNRKIWDETITISNMLLNSVSVNSVAELKKCLKKIIFLSKKTHNYIFYNEFLNVCYFIISFLLYGNLNGMAFSNEHVNFCNYLENKVFGPLQFICIYYLYLYYSNKNIDRNRYTEYANKILKFLTDSHIYNNIYKEFYILHCLIQNNVLDAFSYLNNNFISENKKEKEYSEFIKNYYLAQMYLSSNTSKTLTYLSKCKDMLCKSPDFFTEKVQNDVDSKLSIVYYFHNDYIKSIFYFKKILINNPTLIKINFLFFAEIMEKEKRYIELKNIINELNVDSFDWGIAKKIFIYYKLKYIKIKISSTNEISFSKMDAQDLEDYILKNFRGKFQSTSTHSKIIRNEIIFLNQFSKTNKKSFIIFS